MKKIKILLDYKCFPIWIYDDNDNFIDNDIPKELSNDKDLDSKLVKVQEIYDGLFLDNSTKFEFRGFKNQEDEDEFHESIKKIEKELKEKIGNQYIIENNIESKMS